MLQKRSKKILFYLLLFIIFGTLNNKNIENLKITKIETINVSGLNNLENKKMLNKLQSFKKKNIFFLNKFLIKEIFSSNNLIENYSIFKKYPSTLEVKIKKTKFLAYINKNDKNYLLGSNGKLIDTNNQKIKIPFIYGNFNNQDFFKLKEIIDRSKLDYKEIRNFFYFPSGRWDLEIKPNIIIKLPKNELKKSIFLAVDILNDNQFKSAKILDLRQNDQIIINE